MGRGRRGVQSSATEFEVAFKGVPAVFSTGTSRFLFLYFQQVLFLGFFPQVFFKIHFPALSPTGARLLPSFISSRSYFKVFSPQVFFKMYQATHSHFLLFQILG